MKDEKVRRDKGKSYLQSYEDIGVTEIFPKRLHKEILKDVMGKKIILKDFIELPSTFGGNFCSCVGRVEWQRYIFSNRI